MKIMTKTEADKWAARGFKLVQQFGTLAERRQAQVNRAAVRHMRRNLPALLTRYRSATDV